MKTSKNAIRGQRRALDRPSSTFSKENELQHHDCRKACYWLEMAGRDDHPLENVIDQAHALTGPHKPERMKAQKESLIRNVTILERLGCLDEAGMIKLRKGNAPTITKGPYAGEIVTGDHIIK